jgi:hypothetical protein
MTRHDPPSIEKIMERERVLLYLSLNPNCEYNDVCEGIWNKCDYKNKEDCKKRDAWKY